VSEDLQRPRADLGVFAEVAGRPMPSWQLEALRLRARITAIVAPRQSGKSRSVGTLSAWWALRRPQQRVLIVSAGEDASRRLLADVRGLITGHPLLRVSVTEEAVDRVALSNGSEIRSVPASEKAIRGWSVDLLVVDEAALVTDDIVLGAAFPTTAARPDARIVLASSAATSEGAFWAHVTMGRQGARHVVVPLAAGGGGLDLAGDGRDGEGVDERGAVRGGVSRDPGVGGGRDVPADGVGRGDGADPGAGLAVAGGHGRVARRV
jgi:hypothetical protein